MYCFVIIFAWIAVVTFSQKGVFTEGMEYRQGHLLTDFNNLISQRSVLLVFHKTSKLECAAACLKNSTCHSFFYQKTSKICQLHSTVLNLFTSETVALNGTRYYQLSEDTSVGCPYWARKQGYSYNSTMNLCFAYRNKSVSWDEAWDECANDGGHLLFASDLSIIEWLSDFLTKGSDASFVYLDGNDKTEEMEFKNYRNEVIPVSSPLWRSGDPSNTGDGEDCVAVYKDLSYFKLVDYSCDQQASKTAFICQIDISEV